MTFNMPLARGTKRTMRLMPAPTPEEARSELALLDACARGDRRALEALYSAHARSVERSIARLVGPTADL